MADLLVIGMWTLAVVALAATTAIPVTVLLVLRHLERTQIIGGQSVHLLNEQMNKQHELEKTSQEMQQQALLSKLASDEEILSS